MRRRSAIAAAALAAIFTGALPVAAQDYPTRPITLVVPFPAGGGNDAVARVVAEKMSRTLGQQIVVENRGGAGGTIATRAVARDRPDGYTILLTYTGTLCINPTLYSNAGYDPRKDFAPIGLPERSKLLPDVPTIAESAVPGFSAAIRYGLVAPARTPAAIVERLSRELRAAVMSEEVRERMLSEGAEPLASTSAEYAAEIDSEERKWSALVKSLNLKIE